MREYAEHTNGGAGQGTDARMGVGLAAEREARKQAEATAEQLAALVAREYRRAEEAERQIRVLAASWLEETPMRYRSRRLEKLRSFLWG